MMQGETGIYLKSRMSGIAASRAGRAMCCLLGLLLAGCATYSYVEPVSGDRARVRFVTDTHQLSVLYVYEQPNCRGAEEEWMRLRVGEFMRASPKRLDMPLWGGFHPNAAKEVHVRTDRPFSALFGGQETVRTTLYTNTNYRCAVPIDFAFGKEKDYEVRFHWRQKACFVEIYEIEPDGAGQHTYRNRGRYNSEIPPEKEACMESFKRFRLN